MRVKGVIMSLALHYWMGDVHHCSGPPVSEMTYTVSSGTLYSTIPYCTSKLTSKSFLMSHATCCCIAGENILPRPWSWPLPAELADWVLYRECWGRSRTHLPCGHFQHCELACTWVLSFCTSLYVNALSFSALTPSFGWQKGHPASNSLNQKSTMVLFSETLGRPGPGWSNLQKNRPVKNAKITVVPHESKIRHSTLVSNFAGC